ncbi:AMP-binding protein, partial [Xanthovirga aplysinae]|uniref:AMP-binding protein n=1 Tax=Xanthovirga aplysinae TaxID=2529853 RepID=UPI0012BC4206
MKNFPWFKFYPSVVPHHVNVQQYGSVLELFEESVEKFSDMPAYENMGKVITYRELDHLSIRFANFLMNETNLEKGDRVAIQMPNLLQYPVVMFGALRAGLVVVNTNPLYTCREMEHQFVDSQAKAVIILANFAHNLEKIIEQTSIETVITTEIGDLLGGLKGSVVNFAVKYVKKMVPAYHLPGAIRLKDALRMGSRHTYQKPDVSGDDIAFLQYTGGTTGVAKGAMLLHRNIVANMQQISAWMLPGLRDGKEIVVTALPLYHIFSLTVNCLAMLKIGAHNLLITNPRDMKAFIKDLRKYPFSVITGVNTLFNGLLNQEDFKNLDFSGLKAAVGGGMAVQKVVADKWEKVTGIALAEGYGLTETCPVLSCNPIDGNVRVGTIGIPLPNTEMKIVDEKGQEMPLGEAGEIWARGPQVMAGYWQRPDETAAVMEGEWFKTGDIAFMNEDGFTKIVDRKKEMINVSGFNVYPNEIEEAVAAHPKVLEVGAIGVPDPKSNEVVKVFVVKKDNTLSVDELIQFCKENLTAYKVPKYVEFKDELPKSNVGKILRRILKE